VCATHAEQVEHCGLWLENSATADSADFDGGHGDRNLEISIETKS
jgi:hypothetical protein